MAKKPTTLTDEQIVARVAAKANEAVGWYDSKLSRERERVTRYYNGTLPKRQHDGSSTYVSTDVYDAVEQAKAMNLEVFAGGDHIATFDSDQDMNDADCRVATEYASYVIFRQNPGFSIFHDVMHDGFTARAGVAKVYYEQKDDYSDETFEGSYDEAMAVASHDSVHEFDADHDPATDTYKGTLTRKKNASKICIDPLAPEEFGIAPRSQSIPRANYCHHRTNKTRSELLKEGYDPKKVAKIPTGDEAGVNDTAEVHARHEPVETGQYNTPVDEQSENVEVFESYIRMQIDRRKGARLYKIVHAHNVLLEEPQEVDKAPFLAYVPLPVPHAFYGNNFAARVIPTQNARTVLVRGVLDHTAITTNPRWAVVSGGLLNPREMLENRLGGLVNVRRPDSVAPLPQQNLNPFVFEVMKQLSADKEESTGISALSKGLNKDAISSQNSQGLLDNMMQAGGQRQKVAARHFATNFLVPLMIEVVRLAIVNGAPEQVIEVAGAKLNVDPKQWTERKTCSVSMHLGYGEKDQIVGKMAHAYESMAKDPALQNMFSPQNRYDLIHDAQKLSGFPKVYLTPPDKAPPVQPDPLKTQEIAIKGKLADAAVANSQANNMKVQKTLVIDSQRMDNERHKMQMDAQDLDRTHNRQDLETAARIQVGQEELKLQEKEVETNAKVAINASLNPRP